MNRTCLSFAATRRTRSSALGTLIPALCPGRVALVTFPLGSLLSSTTSAADCSALFGGFAGTTRLSDFPRSCISGLRPRPSPSGPPTDHADGRAPDLAVLAHGNSTHAQVLRPRRVRRRLAITPPAMLPSAGGHCVGTLNYVDFAAQLPGLRVPLPTLRRRPHGRPTHGSGPSRLARPSDVERSHLLFHAGLSRRFRPPHRSQRARLTHWAPPLGTSVESRVGPGMQRSGLVGSHRCAEAVHPLPGQAVCAGCGAEAPGTSVGSPARGTRCSASMLSGTA